MDPAVEEAAADLGASPWMVFWRVTMPQLWPVLLGATSAILVHAACGLLLQTARPRVLRLAAVTSMTCWIGALICGRLIAFLAD
ncbi:MAG: hypothetical protein HC871_09450 [Rhizobiales bacterium]|nr:hypothetical protein [Hyphomicrobiales bacterium]